MKIVIARRRGEGLRGERLVSMLPVVAQRFPIVANGRPVVAQRSSAALAGLKAGDT